MDKWYQKVFNTLLTNIADLLKVKTIITLAVVFAFVYMAVREKIGTTEFMVIATSIITYYFTKNDSPKK